MSTLTPSAVDFSQAECLTTPGPFGAVPGVPEAPEAALKVCARCPIRAACLETAMEQEGAARASIRAGIRGGQTGQQRAALYRRRARARLAQVPVPGTGTRFRSASDDEIVALLRTGIGDQAVGRVMAGRGTTASIKRIARLRREHDIPRGSRGVAAPPTPAAWRQHTRPAPGGHLLWTSTVFGSAASPVLHHGGSSYSVRRLSFHAVHGRAPVGQVSAGCGVQHCLTGEHLTDGQIRAAAEQGARHG
ncbi:WhiB family transcriptional regulator [Streptomyces sp. NPDC088124]|uniref:WhiB family transcriptional regulator n=1 Tax=Streptomyces sp. NPDC088124 TaxID=3154654 RepID=UPI00342E5A7D